MSQQILALEGVRCAGCVLKIERNLAALSGVTLARGNATQRRIRLVWDDEHHSIDDLTQQIETLGYCARPIKGNNARTSGPSLLPRLAVAALGTMN